MTQPLYNVTALPTGTCRPAPRTLHIPFALLAIGYAGLLASGLKGLWAMAAVPVAALLSSIAGFAFSPLCGIALFRLLSSPVEVVQILIVCSIANQATMVWSLRHEIDWGGLKPYVAAGLPGVAVGVWLLLHVNRSTYLHGMGVLLILYAIAVSLHRPKIVQRPPAIVDVLVAFLGGITGGAAGFPSGFPAIWCGMKGWSKGRQRALTQPFILIMQLATVVMITTARPGTLDPEIVLFIPGSLLGTVVGMAIYRRLSDRSFTWVVNAMLLASGVAYLL